MTQETNPSVSIIIGSYNAEKYIRETLDSVANQTFKSFEAIIVDDCSTDSTAKIIQEYCNQKQFFFRFFVGVVNSSCGVLSVAEKRRG